jgi:hypothetical protein
MTTHLPTLAPGAIEVQRLVQREHVLDVARFGNFSHLYSLEKDKTYHGGQTRESEQQSCSELTGFRA